MVFVRALIIPKNGALFMSIELFYLIILLEYAALAAVFKLGKLSYYETVSKYIYLFSSHLLRLFYVLLIKIKKQHKGVYTPLCCFF